VPTARRTLTSYQNQALRGRTLIRPHPCAKQRAPHHRPCTAQSNQTGTAPTMATSTPNNDIPTTIHPLQLSIPLPANPHTTIHIHLTLLSTTLLLFLTSTSTGPSTPSPTSALSSLGSFVYAMPDVR